MCLFVTCPIKHVFAINTQCFESCAISYSIGIFLFALKASSESILANFF
jgi:hypothetical protein